MHRATLFWTLIALGLLLLPLRAAAAGDQAPAGQIMIDLRTNRLRYYEGGRLAADYAVATGLRPGWTPEGVWQVVLRGRNPAWKNPATGLIVPGGIPANPLGTRWLGLNARGTTGLKYGIHGTNQPKAIGTHVSRGCIRMHNADVEQLYDLVSDGARVDIFRSRPHPPTVSWAS